MRKLILGALAGATLIAGQAVAAGAAQPLAVGDRVGATVGQARNYQGSPGGGLLGWMQNNPLLTAGIIGAAIAIPVAIHNSDDDGPRSGGG